MKAAITARSTGASRDAAEMFYWLSGNHKRFQIMGGQSWSLTEIRTDIP